MLLQGLKEPAGFAKTPQKNFVFSGTPKSPQKNFVFSGTPKAGGACLMRYDQTRIAEHKTQHEYTYKRIKASPNGPCRCTKARIRALLTVFVHDSDCGHLRLCKELYPYVPKSEIITLLLTLQRYPESIISIRHGTKL